MDKCINCNEIELKNPKAKYCSDKCRMAFKRRAINLNKAVFGPQPEQRTRTEHNPNTKRGEALLDEIMPDPEFIENILKPKRGKDIENWDDLPISEQKTLLVRGCVEDVPCALPILEPNLKRGKAIKCFADLPLDVQQTIDKMSTVADGKIDKTAKDRRTAIAIHYQTTCFGPQCM